MVADETAVMLDVWAEEALALSHLEIYQVPFLVNLGLNRLLL
jgi:hypothetical protein